MLNLWWRERAGSVITANDDDIEQAFKIWDEISVSQELNISPFIYEIYTKIIIPAYKKKNEPTPNDYGERPLRGITRQDILNEHYRTYGRTLDTQQLRQQILPALETAGLIEQEQDLNDRRQKLIFPSTLYQFSGGEMNSETDCGVEKNEQESDDIKDQEMPF